MNYIYIFLTIIFTVFGQILLKWRISKLNWVTSNSNLNELIVSYLKLLFDPYIILGFFSALIASFCWIVAMTKFELTIAYPFMSLAPSIVFLFGILILGESFTLGKVIGLIFIIVGTIITVKL